MAAGIGGAVFEADKDAISTHSLHRKLSAVAMLRNQLPKTLNLWKPRYLSRRKRIRYMRVNKEQPRIVQKAWDLTDLDALLDTT